MIFFQWQQIQYYNFLMTFRLLVVRKYIYLIRISYLSIMSLIYIGEHYIKSII